MPNCCLPNTINPRHADSHRFASAANGTGIGVATDDLALWLPVGVAIGVALGVGWNARE